MFATGDGKKAKEVFAIQELQDIIFSNHSIAELYQMQRVSKQWTSAITSNFSNYEMQIALRKQQDPTRSGKESWTPELIGLFTSKDGSRRDVLIAGNLVLFILTHTSMTDGSGRHSDDEGPTLELEIQLKENASLKWNNSIADLTEDSRIDMMMFPSPMMKTFIAKVTSYDLSPEGRCWSFTLHGHVGVPSECGVFKPRMMSIDENLEGRDSFYVGKWLPLEIATGCIAGTDVPVNGTLREMLTVLEGHFLKERGALFA